MGTYRNDLRGLRSKYIPPEQSKSNLHISNLDFILSLNAIFSDRFRKEIREKHKNVDKI